MLLSDQQHTILERMDQKQQESLDIKLKADILAWLCPLPMNQVHQTISDRAEKGSGEWFLSSEAFKSWCLDTDNCLWCWGIPGAGKTVLASIVVNHIRRERAETMKNSIGLHSFISNMMTLSILLTTYLQVL